jgi:outer membrane receptor protein involved in Fe transport
VDVVGSRLSEKQKEAPLTVEAMDAIAIKETPASNFYEGLGQLKGVDLTSASIGFKVINTRGFNSTSPVRSLQLIDGVDNQAPGLNFSLGNFLGASELDVQKVDLVVGASSAFYGPNAFNGVVSMTTKSPFVHQGLSAMAKVGERAMVETAVRYAKAYKNKDGVERFAWKMNLFYMRANDWEATDMRATPQSAAPSGNPGGWDAVNRYGDERAFDESGVSGQNLTPGLGIFYRRGYLEQDLVDYNTNNLKLNAAFHYKLKKGAEIIYSTNFGTGTTVYQGDNRYSLRDILFFQNRLEIRKEGDWFIRAYASNEDAGRSYDAVFTAVLLQRTAKGDVDGRDQRGDYYSDYFNFWRTNISNRYRNLPGFIPYTGFNAAEYSANINRMNGLFADSLHAWHALASAWANGGDQSPFGSNALAQPYFQPGTARFDSAFNEITSRTSFTEGGSRFWDRSALYHLVGEKKFKSSFAEWTIGGNGRLYMPNSRGTIFSDTSGLRITNVEFGIYGGMEKELIKEKLKGSITIRTDKNQNFGFLVSPAASLVYKNTKGHIFRFSFSSAIRNPTLQDQYLFYNVGTARLVGNLSGFDSLATVPSLIDYLNTQNTNSLSYFNVAPIKPEKVQTLEVGYRGTLWKQLFVDANYYFSFYQDFIGFNIGAYFDKPEGGASIVNNIRVLRVAANATDMVTTQGLSLGLNYYFSRYYMINGNYSWNKLDRRGSTDPIIPAFNTPEHKFNLGFSGRDIFARVLGVNLSNVGFAINYKWVDGFQFEGSPQFTGFVPQYDMVDAQVNYRKPEWKTTFKLGANNLFDNRAIQVFGGPAIGRLAYFSVLVDLGDKR